jgi:hypothetical protein
MGMQHWPCGRAARRIWAGFYLHFVIFGTQPRLFVSTEKTSAIIIWNMDKPNPWITFWPAWVLVNAIGWMIFTVVFILPFFSTWAAVCIGFLIGLLQWKVLNRFNGIDELWMWASTLPYGLLLFIITLLGEKLTYSFLLPAELLILGILGYVQASILRNYTTFAMIWVFASPIAGLTGTLISWTITSILFPLGNAPPVIVWGLVGLIYGCITGVALIFLENNAEQERWF